MDSMEFNVSVAMNLLLFMALFPMAFIWLRRAYRIIFKKDYSEVALKRGEPPENPKKYAPYTAAVHYPDIVEKTEHLDAKTAQCGQP